MEDALPHDPIKVPPSLGQTPENECPPDDQRSNVKPSLLWSEISKQGESIRSPYVAILFSMGFFALGVLPVSLDVKGSPYWGTGLAALCFLMFIHFIWIWDKTIQFRIIYKFVIIIAIGSLYWWGVDKQVVREYHEQNAPKVDREKKVKKIETLQLRDFFKNDTQDYFQLKPRSPLVGIVKARPFQVEGVLCIDNRENSKFIVYYVDDLETYQIIEMLSTQYPRMLDADRKIIVKVPETSQMLSSKTAIFTGRVIVYHENHLEPMEIALLTKLYEEHDGQHIIFRGPEYALEQKTAMIAELRGNEAKQP